VRLLKRVRETSPKIEASIIGLLGLGRVTTKRKGGEKLGTSLGYYGSNGGGKDQQHRKNSKRERGRKKAGGLPHAKILQGCIKGERGGLVGEGRNGGPFFGIGWYRRRNMLINKT